MLSVIIPTIDGRELWLERCLESYRATSPSGTEYVIERNWPTCNQAWNRGIEKATGDFIHLSADDIEALPDWWEAGMEWIEKDYFPAPRIINPDGSLQSCGDRGIETDTGTWTELTRVPFFSREQMERAKIFPIIPTQYFGDSWVSWRGRVVGIETVVVREMCFIHSFANVGRLDERLGEDLKVFNKAKENVRI